MAILDSWLVSYYTKFIPWDLFRVNLIKILKKKNKTTKIQ